MVEAIPRIASFYVDPECIAECVSASLVRMTRDTVFVFADKYRIVILRIFEEELLFYEVRNNRTVEHSVFNQICKNSTRILVGLRESEGLWRLFNFVFGKRIQCSRFTASG